MCAKENEKHLPGQEIKTGSSKCIHVIHLAKNVYFTSPYHWNVGLILAYINILIVDIIH